MNLIDRYLLRELFKVLLAILLILSLVMSSLGFVKLLEKVAIGDMNPDVVLPLMGFQLLRYLARAIPAAFFLAILMVMGRMYRDNEMTALAACGVGLGRIYRAFTLALMPLFLLTCWLSLWVQPWAVGRMELIVAAQQQESAELAGLQPGRFNEHGQGDLVFYVETIDKEKSVMRNVFIQNRQHGELGLITAAAGQHRYDARTGDHYLMLEDGRRYEGEPGNAQVTIAEFGRYTLRIGEGRVRQADSQRAQPSELLYRSPDIGDRTEFWERVSYPFSLVTLALIALPLSRSLPRQGVYGRMFIAFVVYFAFLNLHAVSVSWMEKQVTPEWVGIWWVQVMLIAFALTVLAFDSRWMRRLRLRARHGGAAPNVS